ARREGRPHRALRDRDAGVRHLSAASQLHRPGARGDSRALARPARHQARVAARRPGAGGAAHDAASGEAMKALARLRGLERRELVRMALPVLALALIASVVTGRERPPPLPPEPVGPTDSRIVAAPGARLDPAALRTAAGRALAAGWPKS